MENLFAKFDGNRVDQAELEYALLFHFSGSGQISEKELGYGGEPGKFRLRLRHGKDGQIDGIFLGPGVERGDGTWLEETINDLAEYGVASVAQTFAMASVPAVGWFRWLSELQLIPVPLDAEFQVPDNLTTSLEKVAGLNANAGSLMTWQATGSSTLLRYGIYRNRQHLSRWSNRWKPLHLGTKATKLARPAAGQQAKALAPCFEILSKNIPAPSRRTSSEGSFMTYAHRSGTEQISCKWTWQEMLLD